MRRIALCWGLGALLLASACSQPEFLDMEPRSLTLDARGQERPVRAVAKNRRGQTFAQARPAWHSEDESVATVGSDGVVRAVGPGQTRIIATYGDLEGAILVEVDTVERLEVSPERVEMVDDGDPFRPTIRVLGWGDRVLDRRVTARCEDQRVCRVDRSHQIWPYAVGETKMIVSVDDQKVEIPVVVRAGGRRTRR